MKRLAAQAARRLPGRALLALALVVALGCVFHQSGAFFRWSTHRDVLREVSVTGTLACGMTLVILSGGIDLAVGSVLALAAVSIALLTIPCGIGAPAATAVVLVLGLAAGAASGGLVARFRVQPFIVTLAMMVFARGLAKHLSGGKKVSASSSGSSGPPPIFDLLDARVLGGDVAVVTLVFLACVALTAFILARTRLGRWLYAVGGNAEAARFSGVPAHAQGRRHRPSGCGPAAPAARGTCRTSRGRHPEVFRHPRPPPPAGDPSPEGARWGAAASHQQVVARGRARRRGCVLPRRGAGGMRETLTRWDMSEVPSYATSGRRPPTRS